jgi:hypothetical protein
VLIFVYLLSFPPIPRPPATPVALAQPHGLTITARDKKRLETDNVRSRQAAEAGGAGGAGGTVRNAPFFVLFFFFFRFFFLLTLCFKQ